MALGFERSKVKALIEKEPTLTLEQLVDKLIFEQTEDPEELEKRQKNHIQRLRSRHHLHADEPGFSLTDEDLSKHFLFFSSNWTQYFLFFLKFYSYH